MSETAGRTSSRLTIAVKEAVLLAVAGSVIGIAYTAVTHKGLFDPSPLPPAVSGEIPPAGPTIITIGEAKSLFESGQALFIDTRSEFDFGMGHIAGATNLPLKSLHAGRTIPQDYPRDKTLIAYCDGASCNSSIEVAALISEAGYTNVRIFFGGWEEWQSLNLPVEGPEE